MQKHYFYENIKLMLCKNVTITGITA